jgi:hypothetical protein
MILTRWFQDWRQARQAERRRRIALLDGVEVIVDRVDPRLRALTNYRSRLLPALEEAVQAVDTLIETLPPPVPISREAWADLPELRAFFTNPAALQETFDSDTNVRDFLTSAEAHGATEVFAALSMRLDRATRFGSEMVGEQILADQQQEAISFSDYRIGVLAADEPRFRRALRRRVLEEVAARAMQKILGLRSRRDMLSEEKDVLKWKLKIFEMRKAGIGTLMHDQATYDRHIASLRSEIGSVSTTLDDLLQRAGTLEDFLDIAVDSFETVGATITINPVDIYVNAMNVETSPERGGQLLKLWELRFGRRRPRIVLLVRFSPNFPSVDTEKALRRAARALGVH